MFYRRSTISLPSRPLSDRLTAMLRPGLAWIGALTRDRRGMSARQRSEAELRMMIASDNHGSS